MSLLIPQRFGRLSITSLSLIGLTLGAVIVYVVLWVIEFADVPSAPGLLALWSSPAASNMLSNLGEVTVAVMGIALTVVAILVQLAGYRYTPRITDLFVRDPVNMAAVGFFVITAVLVVWVNMTLPALGERSPMVLGIIIAVSFSILGLLPYFAYIFRFLTPDHIIGLIQQEAVHALEKAGRRGPAAVPAARRELLTSVEHLDDMAQNAIKKDDKAIAIGSLKALAEILVASCRTKPSLPDRWFATGHLAQQDADFVALHPDMIRAIEQRRTWVEMKVMRGLEFNFRHALGRLPDINQLIANHVRRFVAVADEAGDEHALKLALRYFNTFLRHAINASDVRSAYNVLNEYREMAAELMARGREGDVTRTAERLKYYAHVAFQRGLPFIVETIAHDMSDLLQRSHASGGGCHDAVLETFLEIDREPFLDMAQQEASLRGVRKAQVRLATYYLVAGDERHARRIQEDMAREDPARLRSVWEELAELVDPEWWEVANRDTNWDWLPPERRAQLDVFFGWFDLG